MTKILKITDGALDNVEFIDGLVGSNVLHVKEWRPRIATYKDGGVWQSSPFADGRRLRDKRFANPVEEIRFTAGPAASQNAVIEAVGTLLRLLERATNYWTTTWQNTPIYLVAKADNETNTRYAIIHSYSLPDHDDIFDILFSEQHILNDVTLLIERGHWQDAPPDTSTAIALLTERAFDSRTLGTVTAGGASAPSTEDNVYVANKDNYASISHVRMATSGGTSFGTNMLDAGNTLPIALNFSATNDALYIGSATAAFNDGPFNNLVFNLSQGNTKPGLLLWEYWDGTAWTALTVLDHTGTIPLQQSGSVHWVPPTNWTTTTVGSVAGWWIRLRATGTPGAGTPPALVHRRGVYSVVWPYVEITAANTGGDIPVLLDGTLTARSPYDSGLGIASGVFIGARSVSRGPSFHNFLYFSDEQSHSSINITITLLGATTYVTDLRTATGRKVVWNPSGATSDLVFAIMEFDSFWAEQQAGEYRLFLLTNAVTSTGGTDHELRLQLRSSTGTDVIYQSARHRVDSTTFGNYIDFGRVTLPDYPFSFVIQGSTNQGNDDLELHGFVLIPVDEWAAHYVQATGGETEALIYIDDDVSGRYLEIGALHGTVDKGGHVARLYRQSDDVHITRWNVRAPSPPLLQPDRAQRLFFFFQADVENQIAARPHFVARLNLRGVKRYLGGRGNR